MDFIREYQISDKVCDDLVSLFKHSPDRWNVGKSGANEINPYGEVFDDIKKSTDLYLNEYDFDYHNYVKELQTKALDLYIDEFPYADGYSPWKLDAAQIQYYKPGEGFYEWHCERGTKGEPTASRHLVFMTYLNDVDDSDFNGGTEFYHQNKKIKPKKGKTVIWPADWTYTHRGIVSQYSEKYIITGWFNFI